jgi:hypothetical protein
MLPWTNGEIRPLGRLIYAFLVPQIVSVTRKNPAPEIVMAPRDDAHTDDIFVGRLILRMRFMRVAPDHDRERARVDKCRMAEHVFCTSPIARSIFDQARARIPYEDVRIDGVCREYHAIADLEAARGRRSSGKSRPPGR